GDPGAPRVQVAVNTAHSTTPVTVPVVLPEAGIVAAIVTVPFIAFVVMMGLLASLKSRGTLSSVTKTVAWVGVIAGVVGLCAFNAGPSSLNVFGVGLAASSPASLIFATVHPAEAMDETVTGAAGLDGARIALFFGALAAAVLYTLVVYWLRSYMLKIWDAEV